ELRARRTGRAAPPPGLALRAVPSDEALGLLPGDERPLEPGWLRLARRDEQHVAVAEQRLRADAVDDGPAVDLRRHAEGDATGEIGLDQARDHVHARALSR